MAGDPAYEMYRQATLGDVDFITGDYLAGKPYCSYFYETTAVLSSSV